jgi:hypothetical protein
VKLCSTFKRVASCSVASSDTTLFCSDNWTTDLLMSKFPRLHSFAIDKLSSVKKYPGLV